MSIKKYTSGSWVTVPYRKYETATDTITTLPKEIITDGQSASANIKGNMVQTGTPTPASPIYPSECGDLSENLYDASSPNIFRGYYKAATNTLLTTENNAFIYVPLVQGKKYYVYGCKRSNPSTTIRWVTTSSAPSYNIPCTRTGIFAQTDIFTITAEANENYLALFVCGDSDYSAYSSVDSAIATNCANLVIDNGYKIPILCGNTTTNVYLGEVQSTRQIYKYEFTGSETWSAGTENYYSFVPQTYGDGVPYSAIICSHCSNATINNTGKAVFFKKTDFPDITTGEELKQYCADQYSAGTPVCVWYVLATPTTITLNEPLRKIGTYADSVSVSNIPTTGTAEQFDVDTTLKPSEVQLTYHGWHEHSDTKFTG